VNFDALIQTVVEDVGASLGAFRPELTLCVTILAVLFARMAFPRWRNGAYYVTLLGLCAAVYLAVAGRFTSSHAADSTAIFSGALIHDSLTIVLRGLLLLFAILFTTFAQITAAADYRDDLTEFFVLMLGSLLGMCLMISAQHLLIVMLGVEMASVPCYVLAGMKRRDAKSSEAALKYAVFGAGAAGIMLYGLSLLAGTLGTAHLPTMTVRLAELFHGGDLGAQHATVLALGGLMVAVGVAFKLSAVPFHFWAPDVFEGASAEVAAFLSVASKAAALGLLVRLAAGFSFHSNHDWLIALAPARMYLCLLISLVAAVTCTFGNLAAYGQTNMKRLLAYSTIAHAGYMMMPAAAAVWLAGTDAELAREAVAALVAYIIIYLFMNLGAFAIVAILRNATGSEEIDSYAGLVRTSPGLTVCMAVAMFSLVGLPPLAGFLAKWAIFLALVKANLWALLFIGALNTVLSLFYYLRVVRVMVMHRLPEERAAPLIPLWSMAGSYCALLTAPLIVLFFLVGGLLNWAAAAASTLFY